MDAKHNNNSPKKEPNNKDTSKDLLNGSTVAATGKEPQEQTAEAKNHRNAPQTLDPKNWKVSQQNQKQNTNLLEQTPPQTGVQRAVCDTHAPVG